MRGTLAHFALLLLLGYAALAFAAARAAPAVVVRLGAVVQVAALGLASVDAVRVLMTGAPQRVALPFTGPFAPVALRLDPLAAVFVCALALVGLAVALYAPAYLDRAGHRMSGPALQALLSLLEASILAVLLAEDLVGFFVAWEIMTGLATAVVLADGHRAEVKRAAILYLVVTHIGTFAALAGLLLLLGDAPSYSFDALRAAAASRTPLVYGIGICLALAGFGAKAGVVPLHIWLPEAHPVAPSHVSSLLSGVIIKVGIYAMVRTALDLAGPPPAWVGHLLLVVGLVSALLGVLYALAQHDLKRLLAFHSVENIGIILLGVGLGISAQHAGLPTVAALALAAGLFHVVNHAVFKGLLFLCAGSVHLGAHTHDLEEMGGLLRHMPSTGRAFLIGALAISALPPLNGFASEWLVLQGFVGATQGSPGLLRATAPLFAGGLALTGALAAACFVKAFAVAFLALPRSENALHAVEVGPMQRLAQNALALSCVGLGLAAPWVVPVLSRVGASLGAGRFTPIPQTGVLGGLGVGSVQPAVLAVAGLALGTALWVWLGRGMKARATGTWACGQGSVDGRAAYTASAFSNPIRRIFSNLYQFERATVPVAGAAPYFVMRSKTRGAISPLFEEHLYQPALRLLRWTSDRFAPWASPSPNRGLVVFAVVAALLLTWAAS